VQEDRRLGEGARATLIKEKKQVLKKKKAVERERRGDEVKVAGWTSFRRRLGN